MVDRFSKKLLFPNGAINYELYHSNNVIFSWSLGSRIYIKKIKDKSSVQIIIKFYGDDFKGRLGIEKISKLKDSQLN